MKIIASYDPKPIPMRNCDWEVISGNYEPCAAHGLGATKIEAIRDFLSEAELKPHDLIGVEFDAHDTEWYRVYTLRVVGFDDDSGTWRCKVVTEDRRNTGTIEYWRADDIGFSMEQAV